MSGERLGSWGLVTGTDGLRNSKGRDTDSSPTRVDGLVEGGEIGELEWDDFGMDEKIQSQVYLKEILHN